MQQLVREAKKGDAAELQAQIDLVAEVYAQHPAGSKERKAAVLQRQETVMVSTGAVVLAGSADGGGRT